MEAKFAAKIIAKQMHEQIVAQQQMLYARNVANVTLARPRVAYVKHYVQHAVSIKESTRVRVGHVRALAAMKK